MKKLIFDSNNKTLWLFVLAIALFAMPQTLYAAEPAALLTVQGQGMAPNQIVTLSTGPKQSLSAKTNNNGAVAFSNLKYTPSTNLVFSISYQVKAGLKSIPNNLAVNINPFVGDVKVTGNASRAASIVVSVGSEDSEAIIANPKGYFSGTAETFSGFDTGKLRIVTSIINVEEGCCPRNFKPYMPVIITILAQPQPAQKAEKSIISKTETVSLATVLPEISYGVSVPPDLINDSWVDGMHSFANRTVEHIVRQTASFSTFLQGQTHIDARRSLQQGQAQAAKDHLVSEQLCRFGSLSQNLAASEALNAVNKQAIASALLDRELGTKNTVAAGDALTSDSKAYNSTNCDPTDGNMASSKNCSESKDDTRYNKDIDYTSAVDAPLTLDIDFSDSASTAQEADLLRMGESLFPSQKQKMEADSSGIIMNNASYNSLQTIRSVAKNSFISLLAEKSQGTSSSAKFIKAFMASLGINAERAEDLMGSKPSYYAQMEVLTKKLYQDPAFYVNLIDTPANVERQKAAIRAIKLQQQNDFAQVVKRREMLLAVLLELKLRENAKMVNQRLKPSRSSE